MRSGACRSRQVQTQPSNVRTTSSLNRGTSDTHFVPLQPLAHHTYSGVCRLDLCILAGCRNKGTARGSIDWNVTISFKDRNFAAWPRACEALCNAEPSGRCRYFSHSFRFNNCILCTSCVPEIMLGDDTYASFQRATEDPTTLYTGVLA